MSLALLFQFARQDLLDRHAMSMLGGLWTFLLPLVNILIFTLVFSNIMGLKLQELGMESLGGYGYSIYLITGLLAWTCFASTFSRATLVFHEKAALIAKVRIPLLSLPLYVLMSETVIYLIAMSFFIVFLFLIGFDWSIHWLWWPLIFAIQQLFAYAIGLSCAILSVFIRDVRELVGVSVQLWFWMTPVVYVVSIVPETWQVWFNLNPYFHVVNALRDTMILGRSPDPVPLLLLALFSCILLCCALYVGRRLERDIRDFI